MGRCVGARWEGSAAAGATMEFEAETGDGWAGLGRGRGRRQTATAVTGNQRARGNGASDNKPYGRRRNDVRREVYSSKACPSPSPNCGNVSNAHKKS